MAGTVGRSITSSWVDLPDGQWAELRPWLNHGEAKAVRRALIASRESAADGPDMDTALVVAYVSAWHVIGRDGQPVPLDRPESAPESVVAQVVSACIDMWTGRADPNATAASSDTTPPEPS